MVPALLLPCWTDRSTAALYTSPYRDSGQQTIVHFHFFIQWNHHLSAEWRLLSWTCKRVSSLQHAQASLSSWTTNVSGLDARSRPTICWAEITVVPSMWILHELWAKGRYFCHSLVVWMAVSHIKRLLWYMWLWERVCGLHSLWTSTIYILLAVKLSKWIHGAG